MVDSVLDTDVVIWHLRGRDDIVRLVLQLAQSGRIGLCTITHAEILVWMRPQEHAATMAFLDACAALPVSATVAARAAELIRTNRQRGVTVDLPDALIGATAIEAGAALHTCNARHFPFEELRLVPA